MCPYAGSNRILLTSEATNGYRPCIDIEEWVMRDILW